MPSIMVASNSPGDHAASILDGVRKAFEVIASFLLSLATGLVIGGDSTSELPLKWRDYHIKTFSSRSCGFHAMRTTQPTLDPDKLFTLIRTGSSERSGRAGFGIV